MLPGRQRRYCAHRPHGRWRRAVSAERTWDAWPPAAPGGLPAAVRAQVNGHGWAPAPPLPAPPVQPGPARVELDDAVVRTLHEQAAGLLAAEFRAAPEVGPD